MVIVVDASVAVKLYLAESGSVLAAELFTAHSGNISVPGVFAIEIASALVRTANVDKSYAAAMRRDLNRLALLLNGAIASSDVPPEGIVKAANLAIDIGHPLKDCIYLALAMELGCPLVTCDAKFAAKARGVYAGVRVLGE